MVAKRKIRTGKRGGKYVISKGRKVYLKKKRRGSWGTYEQRLYHALDDKHPVHH